MNDRQGFPLKSGPTTLDELYQRELALLEELAEMQEAKRQELAEVRSQITAKLAEHEAARAKFRVPGTPGRKPKT